MTTLDRRTLLQAGGAALAAALVPCARSQETPADASLKGTVLGQPHGAKVGAEVLASGGNAVDAVVAAALTAGVVAVPSCGIGGYGGHLVVALPDGKKVTCIDFNSAAPAAARPGMYPLNDQGDVPGRVNTFGWLAAGVPGTLAGLQLALDRYGTRTFPQMVQPALRFARDGFEVFPGFANSIQAARGQFARDPASAKLFLDAGGKPLARGATFRNPDLADLLQTLAEAKSVEPFYRGEVARRIAAAFQKNGGLVTYDDMAAYQAREVEPHSLTWRGFALYTAPLTAGGLTVFQALATLKALGWEKIPAGDPRGLHTRVEALRVAWDDRLRYLGDPEKTSVPVRRLLSEEHAQRTAERVEAAARAGQRIPTQSDGRKAGGTIHLSAVDARGMMASLTLTHGGGFGAQVTVPGLGLVLGHGMSRFDPRPDHPNCPGPGKRPLNNMCPTVVLRDGRPVLAVGGTGGRKIPNALFEVLTRFVGRGASLAEAVAGPRLHTEAGDELLVEPRTPEADVAHLKKLGYPVKPGASATIQAVAVESGSVRTAAR